MADGNIDGMRHAFSYEPRLVPYMPSSFGYLLCNAVEPSRHNHSTIQPFIHSYDWSYLIVVHDIYFCGFSLNFMYVCFVYVKYECSVCCLRLSAGARTKLLLLHFHSILLPNGILPMHGQQLRIFVFNNWVMRYYFKIFLFLLLFFFCLLFLSLSLPLSCFLIDPLGVIPLLTVYYIDAKSVMFKVTRLDCCMRLFWIFGHFSQLHNHAIVQHRRHTTSTFDWIGCNDAMHSGDLAVAALLFLALLMFWTT